MDGKKILGDSTLSELKAYGGSGERPVFMIDIYTLLGDPALQLR